DESRIPISFFGSIVDSDLDITSEHRPGSAGNTSITSDSVHAGGRVHCRLVAL
ncbi:hypothetical protein Tco_0949830, partial [Tanacetum coccineum]